MCSRLLQRYHRPVSWKMCCVQLQRSLGPLCGRFWTLRGEKKAPWLYYSQAAAATPSQVTTLQLAMHKIRAFIYNSLLSCNNSSLFSSLDVHVAISMVIFIFIHLTIIYHTSTTRIVNITRLETTVRSVRVVSMVTAAWKARRCRAPAVHVRSRSRPTG